MKWTKKIAYSRKVAPYIFILPFVLSFLIFNLYPILSSLVMSFQKLKGFSSYQWVGFRNYKNLWNEKPTTKFPGAMVGDPTHNADSVMLHINGRPTQLSDNAVDFD